MASPRDRLPVTVLTGYLGSGKTTLLNRILTHQHGMKVAVIVNEFGEVGIDNQLVIEADEEIFEMNNGCICCTGLADPAPVIQTFFVDEDLRDQLKLDAEVTLVDLKHVEQHWDSEEVQEQLAFADVLLLNKIDLVDVEACLAIQQRTRAINPLARVIPTCQADAAMDQILGVEAFNLERALAIDPEFLTSDHDHEHDGSVGSVAFIEDRPLSYKKLGDWIDRLVSERGPDLFRMKGIIQFAGETNRYVLQSVHMLVDSAMDRPWRDGETPSTQFVIIGRDLDEAALRAGFEACVA